MILAASFEFWNRHNQEIVQRPTDDEEVRYVCKQILQNPPSMLPRPTQSSPRLTQMLTPAQRYPDGASK